MDQDLENDGGRNLPTPDAELSSLLRLRERSPLFEGMTDAQMVALRSISKERRYQPDEPIIREGGQTPFVYVLIDGVAKVTKTTLLGDAEMQMAELGSGDVLGELQLVDPQPSSASVIAVTVVIALEMSLDALASSPVLPDLQPILLRNVGRILALRLRVTTGSGADAMQRELDENRARVHAGRFIVSMFAMLAIYDLAIAALVLLPGWARPPTSLVSFALAIWTAVPIVLAVRHTPFSLESYGLTVRRTGHVIWQALIWSIPLLLVVIVVKLAWIRWAPWMADKPLFDPGDVFGHRAFDPTFYLIAIGLYMIHAPLQELVARAGLQGTLQNFIPVPVGRVNWKAIVISNLMFAAAHSFLGFAFCVAAFLPGLYWGWMFAKQRSLIGVAVSHATVGIFTLFVVGVTSIIGGE